MEMPSAIHNLFSTVRPGRLIFPLLILLSFPTVSLTQDLPDKILGYKVHSPAISITNSDQDAAREKKGDASISVGNPEMLDVSLAGIKLSVSAVITSLSQSGKVDFLTFNDFRVNNIPVEIEKYDESFSFNKNEPINLPKPAILLIPAQQILKATWSEVKGSKKEWTVTGRVFVFGKFRKLGFNFKRAVPVDINLKIKNPLIQKAP